MNRVRIILYLLLLPLFSSSAQAVKDYRSNKIHEINRWGYENRGEKEHWWQQAHSQGESEERLNLGEKIEWLIPAQYDDVTPRFSERLAAVELAGKVGYIDKRNRYIIPPIFDARKRMRSFYLGLSAVKIGDKYGYINKLGEIFIEPKFDYAENFTDDYLAAVKVGEQYGAIDLKGDTVVGCHFLTREIMRVVPIKSKEYRECAKLTNIRIDDGFYQAELDKIATAQTQANAIIDDSTYLNPIARVAIKSLDSLKGMVRNISDTTWLIEPRYEDITTFNEELFLITRSDSLGLVDSYGRIVLPCEYYSIEYMPKIGLYSVGKRRNRFSDEVYIGLYNKLGALVLPHILDDMIDAPFESSNAIAYYKDQFIEIDSHGQISDITLERLLSKAPLSTEKGYRSYFYGITGLRPTCAFAHNNIAVYDINSGNEGDGISRLRLAHKIDPDNALIAENFKQAKSERADRRLNNVVKALEVATEILMVAAAVYETSNVIQGKSLPSGSSTSFSSSNSLYEAGASQSSSNNGDSYVRMYNTWEDKAKRAYNSLSNLGSSKEDDDEASGSTRQSMSSSNYTAMKRNLREAQSQMESYRRKASGVGVTIPKSKWETATVSY